MKRIIKIISISLLLLILMGCIFIQLNKVISQSASGQTNIFRTKYNQLTVYKEVELKTEGKYLSASIFLENENGNYRLNEIINQEKLILRYSEINCNTCVDSQIVAFKNLSNKLGVEKLAIFSSYERFGDMYRFKRLNKVTMPIYNLKSDLGLLIDTLNTPYYFILSPTLQIRNVFIPRKEVNEITSIYLNSIERLFQE